MRLVLDTNTLLRGLANSTSASAKVLAACEKRSAVILLSRPELLEYQRVLNAVAAGTKNDISPAAIELVLRRLRFFGDFFDYVPARFAFPRDPTDSKLIELSIVGRATHLVTHDRDLLDLRTSHTDAGKRLRQRLPNTAILTAAAFVNASR